MECADPSWSAPIQITNAQIKAPVHAARAETAMERALANCMRKAYRVERYARVILRNRMPAMAWEPVQPPEHQ